MSKAIIPLGDIVRSMMVRDDRSSMHKYQQFLQIAIECFDELNFDIVHNIKTIALEVDPDLRTADLPEDFIDYIKIGIESGGEIITLSLNEDISLLKRTDSCGNIEAPNGSGRLTQYYKDTSIAPYAGVFFYNVYNNYGQYQGRMYGKGSGLNPLGYYRIDHLRRQIMFSTLVDPSMVVMEYLSSGRDNGCIMVPLIARETIISWIRWQTAKGAEAERFKREYYRNRDWLNIRRNGFTVYEMIDAVRRGIQQSVKT